MKKKINKHPDPEVYRVLMRCGSPLWKKASTRYFTAFHSSEALEDLYHCFHRGRIHADKVVIYDIQEYDKYSHLWVSRMDHALDNIENIDIKTLIIKPGKIIIAKG